MSFIKYFPVVLLLASHLYSFGDVVYLPDEPKPVLRIEGKLKKPDLKDFQIAVAHLKRSGKRLHMDSVQLNSVGGNGHAGREMGRLIRRAKLNTFVAPESECVSACVEILIGGVVRMAYGTVMVHRSTLWSGNFTEQQLKQSLPDVDADTAAYVKEMGMSALLTESMLSTPTWALHTLTDTEKFRWGVHGMERVFEEVMLLRYARELKITALHFAELFGEHFDECDKVASRFEMTPHECVFEKGKEASRASQVPLQ
jgi:hypothetical protein